VPIEAPAALAFFPNGTLGGAASLQDTVVRPLIAAEWRATGDSVFARWTPGWLSGSLELFLTRHRDTLRGRYAMHYHEIDDGRLLWRGNVLALQAPCKDTRVIEDSARMLAIALDGWRESQDPDTAKAVAEAFQAFEAFLKAVPIHTISLFNYGIATYACRNNGRLPNTLDELRDTVMLSPAIARLEERAFRDAWDQRLRYRPHPPGYELRSAGPDHKFGTLDDIVRDYTEVPLRRDPGRDCLSRY